MERAFGTDFASVRAHLGVHRLPAVLGAAAAASGQTVAFTTERPDALEVAHELVHVVQHTRATGSAARPVSRPGDPAEREADILAGRAARGERVEVRATPTAAVHRLTPLQIEEILADITRKQKIPRRYPELRLRLHRHLERAAGDPTGVDKLRDTMTEADLRLLTDTWIAEPLASPAQPIQVAPASPAIPTDQDVEESFGYSIETTKPGSIEKVINYDGIVTPGPRLQESAADAFVGAVATTPEHPPTQIAEKYRTQAFRPDVNPDERFRLAVVVNARGFLDRRTDDALGHALRTVLQWPNQRFRIAAGGFLWHPWRRQNEPVSLTEVRQDFLRLPASGDGLTRTALTAYEDAKKTTAALVPYGPARNQAYGLANDLALDMKKYFRHVLIHFSDADAPSFTARVPEAERAVRAPGNVDIDQRSVDEIVKESFEPLLSRYQEILDSKKDLGGNLPPLVISGGYELRLKPLGDVADGQALTLIGHRLDLAVRSAIAKAGHTGAGANIYLPEPNLLIKWSPELIQVDALFGRGNKESIFLVRNYRKTLATKSASVEVSFDLRANAPTATPGRFKLENGEEPPNTISHFSARAITSAQLKRVCNQSQCYAKFDTWSIAVNDNLEVKASLIEPAFNACMITEQYHYDPELIAAALPRFTMPSNAELTKSLSAALEGIDNAQLRSARVRELVELLHRTGAAMMTFMGRLLVSGKIPDPVLEMDIFNKAVDDLMVHYAPAPVMSSAESPGNAAAPAAKKVGDDQILQGLRDAEASALTEVLKRSTELAAPTIAEALRILARRPFKGSQKAVENVCGRVRSVAAKRAEILQLLGMDGNSLTVGGKTLVALLTPPPPKPPVVT